MKENVVCHTQPGRRSYYHESCFQARFGMMYWRAVRSGCIQMKQGYSITAQTNRNAPANALCSHCQNPL